MSQAPSFLGMPLDAALDLARSLGLPEPEIIRTCAPRRREEEPQGTLRVIRVRDAQWTVSAFQDASPKE